MALSLNLQNNFNFSNKGCCTLKVGYFPLRVQLLLRMCQGIVFLIDCIEYFLQVC